MPFWFALILFVVSFVATALLAPKPNIENAKAAKLGDFRFPRSKEGEPVPLFWGRVRLRGPNTLWYGNLQSIPITKKIKTGIFSSKQIIVGFRYLLTIDMAFGLFSGSGAVFKTIWLGEKEIWSGNVSVDGTVVSVNLPELFGGLESGGGVIGDIALYTGSFTQAIDSHLQSVAPDSTLVPAYRGLVHAVFRDFEVGERPHVDPINIEVEQIPSALGLGAVGSDGDANPAEVLYDIFTFDWGRVDFSTTLINSASFTAAGTTLETEGNGISIKIESANDARDVIQEILQQIDGIIYEEPETREIFLKLIREDYDENTLDEFDESNVLEVSDYSVSAWGDTFNQIRVVYPDRENRYEDKTAFAQDLANVTFQGRVRGGDFNYRGISNATLANQIAARELNAISLPLIKIRLITNRQGSVLRPGDVIKFSWAEYGITDLILRVQKFDLGDLENGRVVLDCIQDRFAVSHTIFSSPPQTDFTLPATAPSAVATQIVQELPRFLGNLLVNSGEALGSDPEESYLQHLALKPNDETTNFRAEVSDDSFTTFVEDATDASFTGFAELNAAVTATTGEVIAGASTFVLKNVSASGLLKSASDAEIAQGANLLLIEDEIIAYGSFTDNMDDTFTLNNVQRGLLDTAVRAHAVDSDVWFLDTVELENFGSGNYVGTESVDVRFITFNGYGVLPAASATEIAVTLDERPRRQLPPDKVAIDGNENPTSISNAVDDNVTLTWRRRDRLNSTIEKPDDADNTSVEAGTTYEARWTVDGGSLQTQNMGNVNTYVLDLTGKGAIVLEVYAIIDGRDSLQPVQFSFNFTV
jgi:hypothetical protein